MTRHSLSLIDVSQSPCSLRSVQCAALIALATAAGLGRMEPATNGTQGTDNAPTHFLTIAYGSTPAWFLDACLERLNSLLRPAPGRAGQDGRGGWAVSSACVDFGESRLTVATTSQDRPVWSVKERPKLQAVDYEIPYAVGPPVGAQNPNQLDVSGRIGLGDRAGVGAREFLIGSPRTGKLSVRVGAVPEAFQTVSAVGLAMKAPVGDAALRDPQRATVEPRSGSPRRFSI
jgi:hypothetical protein